MIMYPKWLLDASQAFEREYDDAQATGTPILLEEALLVAFATATGVDIKRGFNEELMLNKLRQSLEEFQKEKDSYTYV